MDLYPTLAFTALLDLYPGYGALEAAKGQELTAALAAAMAEAKPADAWAFAAVWIDETLAEEAGDVPATEGAAMWEAQGKPAEADELWIPEGYADAAEAATEEAAEPPAWKAGATDGTAAGSWVIDGNTTPETMAAWIKGIEDGDPLMLDQLPGATYDEAAAALADEGIEATDDAIEEYLAAFATAAENEVYALAAGMLPEGWEA
jgi:hypothetical protein